MGIEIRLSPYGVILITTDSFYVTLMVGCIRRYVEIFQNSNYPWKRTPYVIISGHDGFVVSFSFQLCVVCYVSNPLKCICVSVSTHIMTLVPHSILIVPGCGAGANLQDKFKMYFVYVYS